MLTTIETLRPELRKSERKVADFVLTCPHTVIQLSIAVLAKEAGVSEPTIVRFCRAVGCKGFQDFKLKLAQGLVSGIRYFHQDMLPGEPPDDLTVKVFDRAIIALMEVRNNLNPEHMSKAVHILSKAKRVEFYGSEASNSVTPEVQYKIMRLGISTVAYTDPQVYGMAATLLKPSVAVVALCHTGYTPQLLASVDLALEMGAEVVGITSHHSPLAERCHATLFTNISAETDMATTFTRSIVQRVIIDTLTTGLTLQRGPVFLERLELDRIKQKIQDQRTPPLK